MTLDQLITGLVLRRATAADEPFLRSVFVASRPHLTLVPLAGPEVEALIDLQLRAQRQGYAASYADAIEEVVERDDLGVGRLFVARSPEEVRVLDLAVLPEHRGHGVGAAVLMRLVQEAGTLPVRLHVATDNPARRLYERLGFEATATDVTGLSMERRAT